MHSEIRNRYPLSRIVHDGFANPLSFLNTGLFYKVHALFYFVSAFSRNQSEHHPFTACCIQKSKLEFVTSLLGFPKMKSIKIGIPVSVFTAKEILYKTILLRVTHHFKQEAKKTGQIKYLNPTFFLSSAFSGDDP